MEAIGTGAWTGGGLGAWTDAAVGTRDASGWVGHGRVKIREAEFAGR